MGNATAGTLTLLTILTSFLTAPWKINAFVVDPMPKTLFALFHHNNACFGSLSNPNRCSNPTFPSTTTRDRSIILRYTTNNDDIIETTVVSITPNNDTTITQQSNNNMETEIPSQQKRDLLSAIENTSMGFSSSLTPSDRKRISNLADAVATTYNSSSSRRPPIRLSNGSSWKLLYASAPDVLGLRGGPLSRLVSIRQEVSSSLNEESVYDEERQILKVVLEYAPSQTVLGLVDRLPSFLPIDVGDLEGDRLEQSVVLELTQSIGDGVGSCVLELRPKGTVIEGTRFGDGKLLPKLDLEDEGKFLASLGLGLKCRVLYDDGDLRIDRSGVDDGDISNGYLGVYRRIRR